VPEKFHDKAVLGTKMDQTEGKWINNHTQNE